MKSQCRSLARNWLLVHGGRLRIFAKPSVVHVSAHTKVTAATTPAGKDVAQSGNAACQAAVIFALLVRASLEGFFPGFRRLPSCLWRFSRQVHDLLSSGISCLGRRTSSTCTAGGARIPVEHRWAPWQQRILMSLCGADGALSVSLAKAAHPQFMLGLAQVPRQGRETKGFLVSPGSPHSSCEFPRSSREPLAPFYNQSRDPLRDLRM